MKRKNLTNAILTITGIISLSLCTHRAGAQGVAVNTTGATANASAILDVQSTTQGMLVPRMTAAQRTGISGPAAGLMVFQTDAPSGFYYYSGSAWVAISSSATAAGGDLVGTYPNPTISSSAGTGNNLIATLNAASTSTRLNTSLAGSGTANSSSFLRGDQTWQTISGGSGTVTTFSSGNLSPLFTTSVTAPTTAPAQSFTLSSAAANTVLRNTSGSATAPSYGSVTPLELQNTGSGTASSGTYYRGDGQWASPAGNATTISDRVVTTTPISVTTSDQMVITTQVTIITAFTLPSAASFGSGRVLYVVNAGPSDIGNPTLTCSGSDLMYIGATSPGNTYPGIEQCWIAICDGVSSWYVINAF